MEIVRRKQLPKQPTTALNSLGIHTPFGAITIYQKVKEDVKKMERRLDHLCLVKTEKETHTQTNLFCQKRHQS
jgi:hypothetical protein